MLNRLNYVRSKLSSTIISKLSHFNLNKSSRKLSFINQLSHKNFTITTPDEIEREEIETDVLIVGGGPAGLATAIRLQQLAKASDKQIDVTIIEKGSEIGAHIL